MTAGWLDRVLVDHARLDLDTYDGRARMVEAILEAIPRRLLIACTYDACMQALRVRNIRDAAGDLSSHVAHCTAHSILTALEVEP